MHKLGCVEEGGTYELTGLEQVHAEITENVVLAVENLADPFVNPSVQSPVSMRAPRVGDRPGVGDELFHDLLVDLLHIDPLVELGRKLCRLQEPGIHLGRHAGDWSPSSRQGEVVSC